MGDFILSLMMIRPAHLLSILVTMSSVGSAWADQLLMIANPSVMTTTPLTLRQIEAIYLLRVTTWPDGSHIVPVNREASSGIRADFTAAALKQDNAALLAYWNEMHFQGKSPPVVQESEPAMLAFVRSVPGAIGYVAGPTPPDGVKVLGHVP
jgi:ABC-type phosphate transport system substrate-binding protein